MSGSLKSTSNNNLSETSTEKSGQAYKFQEGRRYLADENIAYVLPNDDEESDRVHEQHWILRYLLQGNFRAPVTSQLEEGINVLDSGCGPGTWSLEIAETYPRSKVYGIDCSDTFPKTIKPSNVKFVTGNIAQDLPYEENFFDYIHQRCLILGLTEADWTSNLEQLYKVLKPGGYVELGEPNLQPLGDAGPGMHQIQSVLRKLSDARGLPPMIACELEERLTKAGFVDVVVKINKLPINHGGKAGKLAWADYRRGYLSLRPVMARINLAWENEEAYAAHIDSCGEEAKRSETCMDFYSIYARKPQQSQ